MPVCLRQTGNDEMAVNNLTMLLRQVYEASTREIDSLIGELRGLREKLETDDDHLQSDIAEHAKLSQWVMQLTAIISDSVKELPTTPHLGR